MDLVTWNDVIDKINNEVYYNTCEKMDGTFVLRNEYRPNTIQKMYEEIGLEEMHVYVSLFANAENFGKHRDYENVLLVQAIGKMKYEVEGKEYILSPGDRLEIPNGTWHTHIVLGPRVTLSFEL